MDGVLVLVDEERPVDGLGEAVVVDGTAEDGVDGEQREVVGRLVCDQDDGDGRVGRVVRPDRPDERVGVGIKPGAVQDYRRGRFVFEDGLGLGARPAGTGVDAGTVDGSDLLVSFDVTVPLSGTLFADEDLARWDGAGFSLAFDGSAAGVDPALDLDGAHRLTNGHLLLSFDGFGAVGGLSFADEDVLERDPVGGTWELASDASLAYPGWPPADAQAVAAREPAQTPPAGSLQFSSPTYSRFELQAFAPITVTRTGGTSGTVSVTYASADGTATDGLDYTAGGGTLTWPAGDGTSKTFNVPLIDDTLTEGDETVQLSLSDLTGGAILGVPANAVLTIVDDETTPPSPLEIPTLDARMLAFLTLLLAAAGFLALRGRG